jgi:hypothetical protein
MSTMLITGASGGIGWGEQRLNVIGPFSAHSALLRDLCGQKLLL